MKLGNNVRINAFLREGRSPKNFSGTKESTHLKNKAFPVEYYPWTSAPFASTNKPNPRKADPYGKPTRQKVVKCPEDLQGVRSTTPR